MYFELITLAFAAATFLFLKRTDSNVIRKYVSTFIGVLLFEYFTHPLWINRVETWAYIPLPARLQVDISWVITLGWTTLILLSIRIIDGLYPKAKEYMRFLGYITLLTILGLIGEYIVRFMGVREYDAAVYEVLTGKMIGGQVPIEALYYIPVFMALVVSFSRYWSISYSQPGSKAETKTTPSSRRKRK